ncbi:hypothetical protein BH10BAC2_BH10BAC2_47140 [soil metagenome]
MIRILMLLILGFFVQYSSYAQSIKINKEQQAAHSITLPEKNDLVEEFIEDLIKRSDGKVKHSDGMIIGKGTDFKELESGKNADLYFDLDKTKNDGKEVSVITLAVKDEDGKFANDTSHAELYNSAGRWLNSFQMKLELFKRDKEVAAFTAELKSLTKKLNALRKDAGNDNAKNLEAIKDNEKALSDLSERLGALQRSN